MSNYSQNKPDSYIPRLVDSKIEQALANMGGLELRGTRWCGKSWTAQAFGNSVTKVDEAQELYTADPALALTGEQPHVIDEWQDVPAIWNIARHAIDDAANKPGQYIFTGSSTPRETESRHSGAGRIARISMSTMTLAETGESTAQISLRGLFEGKFQPCRENLGLADYARIICRGGWPQLQQDESIDAQFVVNEYLDALFDISMPKAKKSSTLARQIATSLARNVATSAKLETITGDVDRGGDSNLSKITVTSYIEEFIRNYFIKELHGWDAPIRSKSRLRTKPKRYFEDPSLAAALLNVNAQRLLTDGQLMGLLFESLCIHDLAVYASLLPGAGKDPLRYYSDADDLEVDVIIELNDGRWAGIEIKLGEDKVAEGISNLKRLREKVARNPAARNPKPEFMAVLLGKCEIARYQKDEEVYVIPLGALGP